MSYFGEDYPKCFPPPLARDVYGIKGHPEMEMHYYIWLGHARFELPRPLTRWEQVRCWFSPWTYEEKRLPRTGDAVGSGEAK